MKKITDLLESYGHGKLKALSKMFVDEPTEEEFNKEVEDIKDKGKGKIRNKKIADPSVQGVKEIDESEEHMNRSISGKPPKNYMSNVKSKPMTQDELKNYYDHIKKMAGDLKNKRYTMKDGKVVEESKINERSLSSCEEKEKEDIVKGMKKSFKSFKNLYGDRAKSVMYGTATNMAKEEFNFEEIDVDSLTEEFINEWNASGHKLSKALKWIKANGFEQDRHSKHPAYKHISTGQTVTAFNTHGNEVGAEALRNTRKMIIQHHQNNGIKYKEL